MDNLNNMYIANTNEAWGAQSGQKADEGATNVADNEMDQLTTQGYGMQEGLNRSLNEEGTRDVYDDASDL